MESGWSLTSPCSKPSPCEESEARVWLQNPLTGTWASRWPLWASVSPSALLTIWCCHWYQQGLWKPPSAWPTTPCFQILDPISAPALTDNTSEPLGPQPQCAQMTATSAKGQHRTVHDRAPGKAALSTGTAPARRDPDSSNSPPLNWKERQQRPDMAYGGLGGRPSPAHISSRILSMSGRRQSLFKNRSKISKENSSGRMDSL